METINNILAYSSETKSISEKSDTQKTQLKSKSGQNAVTNLNHDKAEISADARHLFSLQTRTLRFNDYIYHVNVLDEKDIKEIKDKLASGYYSQPEIMNTVINKLVKLPNFIL